MCLHVGGNPAAFSLKQRNPCGLEVNLSNLSYDGGGVRGTIGCVRICVLIFA